MDDTTLKALIGKPVSIRLVGKTDTLEGVLLDMATQHESYVDGDYGIQIGSVWRAFRAEHVAKCDTLGSAPIPQPDTSETDA